jgi:hypothetical protein
LGHIDIATAIEDICFIQGAEWHEEVLAGEQKETTDQEQPNGIDDDLVIRHC